jgi:hypothetical protein
MALFPISLDEEKRKRTTHIEGRGRSNQNNAPQSNWPQIQALAQRIEQSGGKCGDAALSAAASAVGGGGVPIFGMDDAPAQTAFDPPQSPQDAQQAQQNETGQQQFKIWSTFKMFEDEELKRQRDVQDMLQRLREEALRDQTKVADFLREHPELTAMLVQAIPTPSPNGWNMPSGDSGGGSGAVSDGAGGFFL